jgi:glutamine amidotransferase-like uncharacterized protein
LKRLSVEIFAVKKQGMRWFMVLIWVIGLMLSGMQGYAQGYYKDVFMNGGIQLTSRRDLPAARFLDLSMEYFASSRYSSTFLPTRQDTLLQHELIIGSDIDYNGVLLYPDGQPRFRVLVVNGGRATNHGRSLGAEGRDRIQQFVSKGGSYVGLCAGAFLSTAGVEYDSILPRAAYLNIWPGQAHTTGLVESFTGMFVEEGSPLLNYFSFGGDMYIDSVRHNAGGYAFTGGLYPRGTEALLRYDMPESPGRNPIHREISTWAYKASAQSGRVVNTGSHPESATSGDRLELMAAMLLYALDGTGSHVIKANLENGRTREMTQSTPDNNPAYTMIGDKQYHHFTVFVPEGAEDIKVELRGARDFDLHLYMKKGDFAFKSAADYKDVSEGAVKQFYFDTLEAGIWYIAVECYTTVEALETEWGYAYTGRTDVLNGVPYHIKISWEGK